MRKTKSFSFRVTDPQMDFCNKAIEKAKELYQFETKAEAGFKIFNQWFELASAEDGDEVQIVRPVKVQPPSDLEELCALEFLQFIIDPKDFISKWFCLKNQRPDGKGKPILMADGKDRYSIQKLCAACASGFQYHEQRSKLGKARVAIERFGDMEIKAVINCCIHPANNAIQINLGDSGNFYCTKTEKPVSLVKVCRPEPCDYFYKTEAPIFMKETEAFGEVKELLA